MGKGRIDHSKVSSVHTTIIEAAQPIIKEVLKLESVRSVTPGVIQSGGGKRAGGEQRVKIARMNGGVVLKVVTSISTQELYIYTDNQQETMELVARTALENDIKIRFSEQDKRVNRETAPTTGSEHSRRRR